MVEVEEKAYLEACARASKAVAAAWRAQVKAREAAEEAYKEAIKESDGKNKRN